MNRFKLLLAGLLAGLGLSVNGIIGLNTGCAAAQKVADNEENQELNGEKELQSCPEPMEKFMKDRASAYYKSVESDRNFSLNAIAAVEKLKEEYLNSTVRLREISAKAKADFETAIKEYGSLSTEADGKLEELRRTTAEKDSLSGKIKNIEDNIKETEKGSLVLKEYDTYVNDLELEEPDTVVQSAFDAISDEDRLVELQFVGPDGSILKRYIRNISDSVGLSDPAAAKAPIVEVDREAIVKTGKRYGGFEKVPLSVFVDKEGKTLLSQKGIQPYMVVGFDKDGVNKSRGFRLRGKVVKPKVENEDLNDKNSDKSINNENEDLNKKKRERYATETTNIGELVGGKALTPDMFKEIVLRKNGKDGREIIVAPCVYFDEKTYTKHGYGKGFEAGPILTLNNG